MYVQRDGERVRVEKKRECVERCQCIERQRVFVCIER